MPTAARLIAAIVLAVVAWLVSDMIRPLKNDGFDFGWFNYVNAALGFAIGWRVIGSRAGRGYWAAGANGLTAGCVLVFWGLFLQGANLMLDKSMNRRYDGPAEALADTFAIMVDFGLLIATPSIVIALVVGSISAGLLSETIPPRVVT